jgi:hypothetical protein
MSRKDEEKRIGKLGEGQRCPFLFFDFDCFKENLFSVQRELEFVCLDPIPSQSEFRHDHRCFEV